MVGEEDRLTAARVLRLAWAAPCSVIGLLLALLLLAAGARARVVRGAMEVAFRAAPSQCDRVARRLPYRAITFGHVILGVTAQELASLRSHEHVHVAQYERWGPLFLLAYPAASLWQWLAGRDPYWDNPFEVEARVKAGQ